MEMIPGEAVSVVNTPRISEMPRENNRVYETIKIRLKFGKHGKRNFLKNFIFFFLIKRESRNLRFDRTIWIWIIENLMKNICCSNRKKFDQLLNE